MPRSTRTLPPVRVVHEGLVRLPSDGVDQGDTIVPTLVYTVIHLVVRGRATDYLTILDAAPSGRRPVLEHLSALVPFSGGSLRGRSPGPPGCEPVPARQRMRARTRTTNLAELAFERSAGAPRSSRGS
jgi:hypothetical protein